MKIIKKLLIAIFVTLFSVSLFACSNKEVIDEDDKVNEIYGDMLNSTDPSYVRWEGRYDYKSYNETKNDVYDSPRMMLYHTATGFNITFYGTELKVGFIHYLDSGMTNGSNIYYNFSLDDETIPNPREDRLICLEDSKVSEEITLVSGLENKEHTIKCLKMDEAYDAYTGITSFKTDGYFIERDPDIDDSKLKFMFICASGGSGFGSLGYKTEGTGGLSRNRKNSSSLHAFNYLTARMFDAETMFVATSGWGVSYPQSKSILDIIDYIGNTPENSVNGAAKTGNWDPQKWIPDIIIFNIGGNDTTQSGFNQSVYQKEVVELVEKMHSYYPNAKMLWTHTVSNAGKYAITALNDKGIIREGYIKECIIPKVGYLKVSGSDDNPYVSEGASNHNSMETHIVTADILKNAILSFGVPSSLVKHENVDFDDFQWILDKAK